ncbi:MAG: 50S ribosomal protein L32 [Bacillota bacterium]
MGVQQNKRSKARTRRKRTAWAKLDSPSKMECPQCHEPKMPHRVCPACGYYKNREVIKKAAAE